MAEQISPRLAYKSVIILVMCMTIILAVNGLALALNPQHYGDDLGLYEMPAALPSQTSIANSSTQPAAEEGEEVLQTDTVIVKPTIGAAHTQPTANSISPTATVPAPTATLESITVEPAAPVVELQPPAPAWNAQPVEEAAPVVEEPPSATEVLPINEPQPPTESIATAAEGEQREVDPTAESLTVEIPADTMPYPAP